MLVHKIFFQETTFFDDLKIKMEFKYKLSLKTCLLSTNYVFTESLIYIFLLIFNVKGFFSETNLRTFDKDQQ